MDSSDAFPKLKTLASDVQLSNGNSLLHQFVLDNSDPNHSRSEGYINFFLQLMSDCNTVNALNDEGYSALHLAVLKNNLLLVKKLLSCLQIIDVNIRSIHNKGEDTALHLAVRGGLSSIILELLNAKPDLDVVNSQGYSALSVTSDLGIIQLLVANGADVNVIGKGGGPLHFAARSGSLETVEFLVNSGADLLAEWDDDLAAPTYCGVILNAAIDSGNLEVVKFLIQSGADVNKRDELGMYPLSHATVNGDLQVVKLLVNSGADLSAQSGAIFFAAKFGQLEILKYLMSCGADWSAKDATGETTLHCAAKSGDLATVEFLVNIGADVNAKCDYGCTPLYRAVDFPESCKVIEFLVSKGADVNARDKGGRTPIFLSVACNSLETFSLLVDLGANINFVENEGETLLHVAAVCKSLRVAEVLLERGCDVNAADKRGRTPLHVAAYRYHLQFAKLLLEKGANKMARDNNGKTPFDCLQGIYSCTDALQYLLGTIEQS